MYAIRKQNNPKNNPLECSLKKIYKMNGSQFRVGDRWISQGWELEKIRERQPKNHSKGRQPKNHTWIWNL